MANFRTQKLPVKVISFAGEVAWNLREWVREISKDQTLQAVLDVHLPSIRAELELLLIDSGLSPVASEIPGGNKLTAASLIAFVETSRFADGIYLEIPAGKPPIVWKELANRRAVRIALTTCDEHDNLMFDAANEGDIEKIEAMDPRQLHELWIAIEGHDPLNPAQKRFSGIEIDNNGAADGPCGHCQWRHNGEVLAGTMQVGAWKMVKHLWEQPDRVASFDELIVPVYGDREYIADDVAFGAMRREANKFFSGNGIPWRASLKKNTVSLKTAE